MCLHTGKGLSNPSSFPAPKGKGAPLGWLSTSEEPHSIGEGHTGLEVLLIMVLHLIQISMAS